jgi:hypothetical protein
MPRPDDPRIGASSPTDRRGRRPVSVGQNHCDLVGRTGFEPVTSSVSGNFRTVLGVCHRRTGSSGEPLPGRTFWVGRAGSGDG